MSKSKDNKMDVLMFKAGIHDQLKGVQRGTGIKSYITLINIHRGYQMIKGKKMPYNAHDGTKRILEDFFGVPWDEIFEDRSGEDTPDNEVTPSEKNAINETFAISKTT